MNITNLKNKIKERIGVEPNIISVFQTGSGLFCTNYKDLDYNVIIENNASPFKIWDSETKTDYFVSSKTTRDKQLNFEMDTDKKIQYVIDECFKTTSTIYGDSSINIDLINNSYKYKQAVKHELARGCLHPNVGWENSDKYCHKHLWWVILGLLFIENKSYEVTDEMKNIIQKCHDGVLDKYWETWVKERLE